MNKRIKYKGQIYEAVNNERVNLEVIELKLIPGPLDENGDYKYSVLVISHDGGKDEQIIKTFNQIQELNKVDFVGEISDYMDVIL